jgi:cyclophilin family peptidyl-prolyl cis-trans isomerase
MLYSTWKRITFAGVMTALLVSACGRGLGGDAVLPSGGADETGTPINIVQGPINQWDLPPDMSIDPEQTYIATLKTEKGDVVIELFADKTPVTVNNFVFLANEGFYDGTTFHRVIADFMAQGGDPTGTGAGGPGYLFEDEIVDGLIFNDEGLLAMANAGPGTNGSQFFITYGPAPWLNGLHTIFGKVVEGMDVVRSLTLRDPQENPPNRGDAIFTVEIEELEESILPTPTATSVPVVPEPAEGRPLAELEIPARENIYSGMPEMVIDMGKTYEAVVTTTRGNFTILLEPLSAPRSVNNFVVISELGYFDGFPVSALQEGALVLTGSPRGTQDSDIGYTLPSEASPPTIKGAVGFWFRPDVFESSGSQVFILLDDVPGWEASFTVFGNVTGGMQVVESLTLEDRIERVEIRVR